MSKKKPTSQNQTKTTDTFDYSSCPCVESIGANAVYVTPSCPHVHLIKGRLVTTKGECRRCHKRGNTHEQ